MVRPRRTDSGLSPGSRATARLHRTQVLDASRTNRRQQARERAAARRDVGLEQMVDDILADLQGPDVFGQPGAVFQLQGDLREFDQLLRDILRNPSGPTSSDSVPHSANSLPSPSSTVSLNSLPDISPIAPQGDGLSRSRSARRAQRGQAARQSRQARRSRGQAVPTPARPTPRRLERQRWRQRAAQFTELQQRRRQAVDASRWRGRVATESDADREGRQARTRRAVQFCRAQHRSNLWKRFIDMPDKICSCCQRTFYAKSGARPDPGRVPGFLQQLLNEAGIPVPDPLWLCSGCREALRQGKMPALCVANGLALAAIPPELAALNFMELRLVTQVCLGHMSGLQLWLAC